MTPHEWKQVEATVAQMTDAERKRLAKLLRAAPAESEASLNPSLGLFADEPELIDEILAGVYHDRRYNSCE